MIFYHTESINPYTLLYCELILHPSPPPPVNIFIEFPNFWRLCQSCGDFF